MRCPMKPTSMTMTASSMRSILFFSAALSTCSIGWAQEAVPAADAAKVTYDEHIRPILRDSCFSCHNQDRAKSDLIVDNYAALMRGGASGEVVIAGDPDSSRIWHLVSHQETPEMPPEQDKLPEAKLTLIQKWILGGALENNGSTAKPSTKPKFDLAASGGGKKPEGPAAMPENLSKQPVLYTPKPAAVTALAASPWAPLVAVAGQKQIVLYNSDSGELLGVLPFPDGVAHVLKFSRGGSLLLAGGGRGGQRGTVIVYDVRTGEQIFQVGDELDVVLAADINEDHSKIALGGPSKVVRVFSTADGAMLTEIRKHTEWIYSLEFSPDGVLLATADRNGGMFVWESETGREYQSLKGHTASITDVSWRIDSNVLASSSEDGTVKLWEMNGGTQIKSWAAHGGGTSAVEFTHDGRVVTSGRDKVTTVWDQNGTAAIALQPLNDLGLDAVFTYNGARVVAGDWSGEIRMCEVSDGKLVCNLPMNPPTLEMVAQATAAQAATAQGAADQLAAELAAIQQTSAAQTEALRLATEKFAASQLPADKAEVDRITAEKTATDLALAEKTAAAQAAATAAAVAKTAADKAAGDIATAQASAAM